MLEISTGMWLFCLLLSRTEPTANSLLLRSVLVVRIRDEEKLFHKFKNIFKIFGTRIGIIPQSYSNPVIVGIIVLSPVSERTEESTAVRLV